MQRASIHEQYDVGIGGRLGKAKRTGTSGTGETNGRLGKARKAERAGSASRTGDYGTSETGGTGETSRRERKLCHVLKTVYSYFVSLIYVFHFLS